MKIRYLLALLLPLPAIAAPSCVVPDAHSIVLMQATGNLADGFAHSLWLQNIATHDRILLRECSGELGNACYFATDVVPGKYYFQQVSGGVHNGLAYPVAGKGLWFEIGGLGVDYVGDWNIERADQREVKRLGLAYDLKHLDAMVALCGIKGRKIFLDKTKTASAEVVD